MRVAAAKYLVSVAYPDELCAGIQVAIMEQDLVHQLLEYARNGQISVHRHIPLEELEIGDRLAIGFWSHLLPLNNAGAGGKVFKGKWKSTDVVIKMFGEEAIDFSIESFRFELALMSVVRHDNILGLLGGCDQPPNFFMVTKFQRQGRLD